MMHIRLEGFWFSVMIFNLWLHWHWTCYYGNLFTTIWHALYWLIHHALTKNGWYIEAEQEACTWSLEMFTDLADIPIMTILKNGASLILHSIIDKNIMPTIWKVLWWIVANPKEGRSVYEHRNNALLRRQDDKRSSGSIIGRC